MQSPSGQKARVKFHTCSEPLTPLHNVTISARGSDFGKHKPNSTRFITPVPPHPFHSTFRPSIGIFGLRGSNFNFGRPDFIFNFSAAPVYRENGQRPPPLSNHPRKTFVADTICCSADRPPARRPPQQNATWPPTSISNPIFQT